MRGIPQGSFQMLRPVQVRLFETPGKAEQERIRRSSFAGSPRPFSRGHIACTPANMNDHTPNSRGSASAGALKASGEDATAIPLTPQSLPSHSTIPSPATSEKILLLERPRLDRWD